MLRIKEYFHNPEIFGISILEHFFTWLPDKLYIRMMFRLKMGYKLDLHNPQTFSEKLQWLKLYNRKPEYTNMVDKYAVKDYVASKIGEEYIIPTLGVWERPEDIQWEKLPDRFVLKTTHGGGNGGVVICRNKIDFDKQNAIKKLNQSIKQDIYKSLREWPYKNVKRRIIAEQYLEIDSGVNSLYDYKFFTFNGEPQVLLFCSDRKEGTSKWDFYDMDMQRLSVRALKHVSSAIELKEIIPSEIFEQMKQIARALSQNIPYVSIDLYYNNRRIYFGEITFFSGSGYIKYNQNDCDLYLGNMLILP
jgi:hypothetical protein